MIIEGIQKWSAYVSRKGYTLLNRSAQSIKSMAVRVEDFSREETGRYPPPLMLDGHIDRIKGTEPGDLKKEISYATSSDFTHKSTKLYFIDNVLVDNGYLYKGGAAEYISKLGRPTFRRSRLVGKKLLASTAAGSSAFGDWAVNDNILELLANDLGVESLRISPHVSYAHRRELLELLGLGAEFESEPVEVQQLIVVGDEGYNSNKTKRIDSLRSRFRKHADCLNKKNDPIYICRGKGRSRVGHNLLNEDDVVDYLSSNGFQILSPEEMSVKEVLNKVVNSNLVIGIEGSQLTYGLLGLSEGGKLMTLQPPYRFKSDFRPRCESIGINWGFLVGIQEQDGFRIPVDDIKRILDKYS